MKRQIPDLHLNQPQGVLQGAQATVSFTDSQLANGQYTLSAPYSGDNNYGGSSAPTTINVGPNYSLTESSNSITNPGGSGNVTLTINALDGFNGTVIFAYRRLVLWRLTEAVAH